MRLYMKKDRDRLIKVRILINGEMRTIPAHKFRVRHMEHLGEYVKPVKKEKKGKVGRPKKSKTKK